MMIPLPQKINQRRRRTGGVSLSKNKIYSYQNGK